MLFNSSDLKTIQGYQNSKRTDKILLSPCSLYSIKKRC